MSLDPWAWLGSPAGETAMLMRRVDWASTAVGGVETWPASLKNLVAMILSARQPMFLWWGPHLVQFYNDAYVPSFGIGRHPAALGQQGKACWAEIWPTIGPEILGVIERRAATFHEDALVPIFRNGRMEEVYWTYGYSPVFEGDGSVAGVLVVVTETTSRTLALRRLRTAQTLAEKLSVVMRRGDLAMAVVQALGASHEDSPWAIVYNTGRAQDDTVPVAVSNLAASAVDAVLAHVRNQVPRATPPGAGWPVIDVSGVPGLPGTPWPEPSTLAVHVPFGSGRAADHDQLLIGLSPRLPYDDGYRDHIRGLLRQLDSVAQRIDSQDARVAAEGARNDLLMQAPFAAALLVGPQWRYELANPLYVRMVGREVIGRPWRDCFPELHGSPVEDILARVYQGGETFVAGEQLVPLVRETDGVIEDRFFDFNMIPIRFQGNHVDAMMVVAVEMTAKVRARRDLERNAAEREALVRDLEEASRTKDDFLAMLGHELRNPLSPIVTALALMRRRQGSDTTREQEVIGRQVTHMVRLVDDLLDVSRVTRGKIELRRTVSSVAMLVDNAIETVSSFFEDRGHRMDITVEPGLRWEGDATRLEQVIANLLTNAARYTPAGGHVRLSADNEHGDLVIRVEDNGQGLEPELLPRLFEPFVQGQRARDRQQGGLGLGLAVVKGLVALHQGSVEAHSDGPGRGSEFVVRMPGLVGADIEAEPRDVSDREGGRQTASARKRVLVVDDNRDAANLLAELLQLRGHEVAVAHDGPSALTRASTFKPEVALLDIGLPILDGYQLLGALRQLAGHQQCRYVALTGYGQPPDVERAAAAGFERLLVKPVDVQVLERVLDDGGAPAVTALSSPAD